MKYYMYVHERVTLELLINKHSKAAKNQNQKSQINFTCARLYNQYSLNMHDLKYSTFNNNYDYKEYRQRSARQQFNYVRTHPPPSNTVSCQLPR